VPRVQIYRVWERNFRINGMRKVLRRLGREAFDIVRRTPELQRLQAVLNSRHSRREAARLPMVSPINTSLSPTQASQQATAVAAATPLGSTQLPR
jgi:hypothetical protein